MTRLILRLLGIKDFEVCASCETLKHQLSEVNKEKRELTETLLQLVKPEIIHTAQPTLINPATIGATFNQRRKNLEEMHRRKTNIAEKSPFVAKPDVAPTDPTATIGNSKSISELEAELAIGE